MRLSVVVPCYNEGHVLRDSIRRLIDLLHSQNFTYTDRQFEVILVIEKSSDDTIEIAKEAAQLYPGIKIMENEKRYGKGFSVRRGILESKGEIVLVVDADLPINLVKYYPLMNLLIMPRNVGAVYCTALGDKINIQKRGWRRSFLSFALFTLRRFSSGKEITDSQLGCKLYKGDAIRRVIGRVTENGFLYELQLTDLILDEGFQIEECAVRIDHFSETSSVNMKNMIESALHFFMYSLYGRNRLLRREEIVMDNQSNKKLRSNAGSIGKFLVILIIVIFGINKAATALATLNNDYSFMVEQDNQTFSKNVLTNVVLGYGSNGSNPSGTGTCNDNGNDKCNGTGNGNGNGNGNGSGTCNDNGNDKCNGNGIGNDKKNDKDN